MNVLAKFALRHRGAAPCACTSRNRSEPNRYLPSSPRSISSSRSVTIFARALPLTFRPVARIADAGDGAEDDLFGRMADGGDEDASGVHQPFVVQSCRSSTQSRLFSSQSPRRNHAKLKRGVVCLAKATPATCRRFALPDLRRDKYAVQIFQRSQQPANIFCQHFLDSPAGPADNAN